jgi:hypothetical protein
VTENRHLYLNRHLLLGLVLVTVGVLFLLREIGLFPDISVWPLIVLTVGVWLLVATITGTRRGWLAPVALVGIGLFLLMRDLGAIDREIAVWPIVLIVLGLAMLLDARRSPDDNTPQAWR